MKPKLIIMSSLILLVAVMAIFWHAAQRRIDKTAELNSILAPLFLKYGLTDDRLVNKRIEENHLAGVRYLSVFMEYDVPGSFVWLNFDPALRRALKKTAFKVFDAEQTFRKDVESFNVIINFGKLDVLTLKINREGRRIPPPIEKVYQKPRVAIVVDDFGYTMNNVNTFLAISEPLTFSVLPNQPYSRKASEAAIKHGFEVILHLPMESDRGDAAEESDTIKTGMSDQQIVLILKKQLAAVNGIDGVSNHQGSKATSDRTVMTAIMKYLKLRGLYYFDSLTSAKSVCASVAKSVGIKTARRDVFLDNSNNTAAIEKQLGDLKALAFKRGSAIAVCHDRKNTAAVLAKEMPRMASEGIDFVKLSEMVKR